MALRVLFIVCFLLLPKFLTTALYSQLFDSQLSRYSTKDGLSQHSILSIAEDSLGYIWVGTRNGVNRFDGYSFASPKVADSVTYGSQILDISPINSRQLLFGTDNGVFLHDNELWQTTALQAKWSQANLRINSFMKMDKLWYAGTSDGLFLIDLANQELTKSDHELVSLLGNIHVNQLIVDSLARIWVATTDGLFLYDKSRNKKVLKKVIDESRIEDIVIHNNYVYVASYGEGLFCLDFKTADILQTYNQLHSNPLNRLKNDYIRALTIYESYLVLGTFEGVATFDLNSNLPSEHYLLLPLSGLQNQYALSVRALFTDSKQGIWIGSYHSGLLHRDSHQLPIISQLTTESFSDVGYSNLISAFAEDQNGTIYLGTERGSIRTYEPTLGKISKIAANSDLPANSTIKKLLYDKNQNTLWVGTFRDGLVQYQLNSKLLQKAPTVNSSSWLKTAIVNDLIQDPKGNFWIATDNNGGLNYYEPSTAMLITFDAQNEIIELLNGTPVKCLFLDHLGTLWIGTNGKGLIALNADKKNWVHYPSTNEKAGLNYPVINYITEAPSREIWIGTNGGGVNILDRNSGRFTYITKDDGLNENVIHGINIFNDQTWVTTLSGMTRFDADLALKQQLKYTNQLPLEELYEKASFRSSSGDLYVGGSPGFVHFNLEEMTANPRMDPVYITELESVSGSEVSHFRMLYKDEIELNNADNTVRIHFTLLNYLEPTENTYRFKLEGFDDEWVESGNIRVATYTKIPPGTYTFRVQAFNNDGKQSAIEDQLRLTIHPPFWQTKWALAIYFLLIVSALLLWRNIAIRGERLQNSLKLREMEKQKLQELHSFKLQSFSEISHEFRTPLSLIMSPLEQILEKEITDNWLKRQLQTMKRNSDRLLSLVKEIIELSELEQGISTLIEEPLHLPELIRNTSEGFQALCLKKNIHLSLNIENTPYSVTADRDKIQKVFYNIMSNAIKFNKEGGEVQVSLSLIEQKKGTLIYSIDVKDTGQGISPKEKGKVFDRFYRDKKLGGMGIGLALSRNLVEFMGGSIDLESEFGKGTTFKIILPLKKASKSILEAPELSAVTEPNVLQSENKKPVLIIVEDDLDLQQYLKESFESRAVVHVFNDASIALPKLEELKPDVIVSDVMMPDLDGIAFLQKIKKIAALKHIPIILLTAKSRPEERLDGLRAGASDYLTKPFKITELLNSLRTVSQLAFKEIIKADSTNSIDFAPKDIQLKGYDDELLERIHRVIEEHIESTDLNVDFLGKQVGLSRVHLYRKLKQLVDKSPSDIIREMRLKRAAQLLLQQKISVSDVAFRTGFNDINHFGRSFKKYFGSSPTTYIKENV